MFNIKLFKNELFDYFLAKMQKKSLILQNKIISEIINTKILNVKKRKIRFSTNFNVKNNVIIFKKSKKRFAINTKNIISCYHNIKRSNSIIIAF